MNSDVLTIELTFIDVVDPTTNHEIVLWAYLLLVITESMHFSVSNPNSSKGWKSIANVRTSSKLVLSLQISTGRNASGSIMQNASAVRPSLQKRLWTLKQRTQLKYFQEGFEYKKSKSRKKAIQ